MLLDDNGRPLTAAAEEAAAAARQREAVAEFNQEEEARGIAEENLKRAMAPEPGRINLPLLSSAIFYAREANVDPLVVDEADHKRTAALEAARQFDATPPPTAEDGAAAGNQAAGAAAMHSGEGSRQWAA